jgi:hypothetical protein
MSLIKTSLIIKKSESPSIIFLIYSFSDCNILFKILTSIGKEHEFAFLEKPKSNLLLFNK